MDETEKRLGKIHSIDIKIEDGRFGLYIDLASNPFHVISSSIAWDPETIKVTEHTMWTEEERNNDLINIMRRISLIMNDANVSSLSELKNMPVEIILLNGKMKDWRILKEVL